MSQEKRYESHVHLSVNFFLSASRNGGSFNEVIHFQTIEFQNRDIAPERQLSGAIFFYLKGRKKLREGSLNKVYHSSKARFAPNLASVE